MSPQASQQLSPIDINSWQGRLVAYLYLYPDAVKKDITRAFDRLFAKEGPSPLTIPAASSFITFFDEKIKSIEEANYPLGFFPEVFDPFCSAMRCPDEDITYLLRVFAADPLLKDLPITTVQPLLISLYTTAVLEQIMRAEDDKYRPVFYTFRAVFNAADPEAAQHTWGALEYSFVHGCPDNFAADLASCERLRCNLEPLSTPALPPAHPLMGKESKEERKAGVFALKKLQKTLKNPDLWPTYAQTISAFNARYPRYYALLERLIKQEDPIVPVEVRNVVAMAGIRSSLAEAFSQAIGDYRAYLQGRPWWHAYRSATHSHSLSKCALYEKAAAAILNPQNNEMDIKRQLAVFFIEHEGNFYEHSFKTYMLQALVKDNTTRELLWPGKQVDQIKLSDSTTRKAEATTLYLAFPDLETRAQHNTNAAHAHGYSFSF